MSEAPDVKLSIRLPADMHATLTEQAKREERSLNGQIVYLLRQTLGLPLPEDIQAGRDATRRLTEGWRDQQ